MSLCKVPIHRCQGLPNYPTLDPPSVLSSQRTLSYLAERDRTTSNGSRILHWIVPMPKCCRMPALRRWSFCLYLHSNTAFSSLALSRRFESFVIGQDFDPYSGTGRATEQHTSDFNLSLKFPLQSNPVVLLWLAFWAEQSLWYDWSQ